MILFFCCNFVFGLVYGMPVAPVRLFSSCGAFIFLLVPSPSGIYEILGTKVGSPGSTPRNAIAIGREFGGQPSAFCHQNGYSRKIPYQFLALCPLRLTAWSPCKELSIPERAVDKKNSTQRRQTTKRMSDHSRVDDFFQNKFHLNRSRRNTNRRISI